MLLGWAIPRCSAWVLTSRSLVNAGTTQIDVAGASSAPLQNLYPNTLDQAIGRADPSFMTPYCCTARSRSKRNGQPHFRPAPWSAIELERPVHMEHAFSHIDLHRIFRSGWGHNERPHRTQKGKRDCRIA